jgi:uncharacterized protein (DUF4415 family)
MRTASKSNAASPFFGPSEVAAAKASASRASARSRRIEWDKGVVTPGGGGAATIASVRRGRGPNKKPTKEHVAIRLDREIVGAFRAGGPGWQTRLNEALKEWLAARSGKKKPRRSATAG